MKVDVSEWHEFEFGKLIDYIGKAKALNKDDLNETKDLSKGIRYITRTSENNGCELLANRNNIDEKYIQKGNAITVGDTTATCFYQKEEFITGDHMVVIRAKWLNELTGLFIVSLLNREMYKYSYGRAFVMDKIKETILNLPVTKEGTPDWQVMEDYIKNLHYANIKTGNIKKCAALNTEDWKEYTLNKIFKMKGGYYNKKPEHSIAGDIPFLASTDTNNGVTEYYSVEDIKTWNKIGEEDNKLDRKMFEGNCVTVTVNGSVCNAYYQESTFTCSHDITALYLKNYHMNKYIGMFISTVITKEKYRWSYGRKPHDIKKFGKSVIKLPSKPDGSPDWQFMEDYIKSLPYGDRI